MPKTETRKTVGTVVGGEAAFGPGVVVSLDLTRGSYVRVPGGFRLTRWEPTARIPTDLNADDLATLESAFNRGLIVLGPTPIRPPERVDALVPLFKQLDESDGPVATQAAVMQLLREHKLARRMTQYEVVQSAVRHEIMARCRDEVVNYLVEVLNTIPGPTPVRELPQDNVPLTIVKEVLKSEPAKLPDYI